MSRRAQSGVSRALFHPEIAAEFNFDLESRFEPSETIRRTSLQVRLSEVASLYVSYAVKICHMVRRTARFRNEINQFETRRDDHRLYLCHLPRGTSDLLGGPKEVFQGLCFTPKLPLNPILTSS